MNISINIIYLCMLCRARFSIKQKSQAFCVRRRFLYYYIIFDFNALFWYNTFMTIYNLLTNNGAGISRFGLLNVVAFIVALLAALVLHEIAHGLVALWNGDPTAKIYGRLSLNPLKHFDLIGLLMMLLVGFGWAKPVPVNPNNFKDRKVGAITVSIAGVLTNLLIALVSSMCFVLFAKINPQTESMVYFVYFLRVSASLTMSLNVTFALFNLLPLYPLDGYRLLSCFVYENNGAMAFLRRYSLYILLGFIVLNHIPIVSAYSPLNLYLGSLGGLIENGFVSLWRLIFNV